MRKNSTRIIALILVILMLFGIVDTIFTGLLCVFSRTATAVRLSFCDVFYRLPVVYWFRERRGRDAGSLSG